MEIITSNNGFPYAWKAGRVEQLIRSILKEKARTQLKCDRVMIVNPTWMHEDNILESINKENPDFIICHNFVDPVITKLFDAIKSSGIPYILLGNAAHCRIDFWAIVCDLYFQHYTEQELYVVPGAKKYVCYNRKPHPHRQVLVQQLIHANLKDEGHISLGLPGESALTVDESFNIEQGINDEHGNLNGAETFVSNKIKNDIFSIGNLNVWQNSYLCLVTETEFGNTNRDEFFISEKTWKPVLGMRPFFVYGQPALRQYLKDQGFDIFEDMFDYSAIDEAAQDPERQRQYSQVAIDAINNLESLHGGAYGQYCNNFYRFQKNRERFYSYAHEQWNKLVTLDLTHYV